MQDPFHDAKKYFHSNFKRELSEPLRPRELGGNDSNNFIDIQLTTVCRYQIVNAVQCHSLLSGHYDCNSLRLSIVRNVNNFTTSLGLAFEGVL